MYPKLSPRVNSMAEFIDTLLTESKQAFEVRKPHEPLWQEIADYVVPQLAEFVVEHSPGTRRDSKINDAHAIEANTRFSRALSGLLTPEGFQWLGLRVTQTELAENESVKRYLELVVRELLDHFHSPASGFYSMADEFYTQIGAFGNSPVFIGERDGLPYYVSLYLGETAMHVDERGRSIADYRRYKQTAWQLYAQFGPEILPREVLDALEKAPGEKFICHHIVRARKEGDPVSFGHPILSAYILEEPKLFLRRPGGFFEDPIIFPRWKRAQNAHYGFGPAENALGDIKMLQKVVRDTARGIHKSVDPNIILADDGTVQPRINQNPGGLWYAEWTPKGEPKIREVQFTGNVSHGLQYAEHLRNKIDKHFHLDAFELPPITTPDGAKNHMSATEFAGRQRQQLQFAGPIISRLRAEFLFPLVRRSYMTMLRSGRIPLPPPELAGTRVVPEYMSPLALALRSHESDTVMGFMAKITSIAQVDPRVLLRINPSRTVEVLADSDNVPRKILNTEAEYEALLAQQAQRERSLEEAQALESSSGAAADQAKALKLLRSA